MSRELALFKLVSGEEVIATVLEQKETYYVLKDVRTFIVIPNGQQSYALDIVPLLRGEPDGEMTLFRHAVTGTCKVSADLERAYLSRTSGIEIASSLSPLMG
jgi:hypothetical protein